MMKNVQKYQQKFSNQISSNLNGKYLRDFWELRYGQKISIWS
jgi:hypothetical protein